VLGGELLAVAVFLFLLREHPIEETGMVHPRLLDPADLYQVSSDTNDHETPMQ